MTKLLHYSNNKYYILGEWELTSTIKQLEKLPKTLNRDIILNFLNSKYLYSFHIKKRLMQALRHFDEVGVCNEIWEALDSLTETECGHFCFFDDNVNTFPCNEFDLVYDIKEIIDEKDH